MICVGLVIGVHGLRGCVKFLMKYSYSCDLLLNRVIFDENGNEFFARRVFGIVKNRCIVELEDINTIDQAQSLKNKKLYINFNENERYNAELIGFKVYRNDIYIGKIFDVFMQNGLEFLETNKELIDSKQIKSIDYESSFVFLV